jgi:acyl-CoA synthetase (AMP-forming)/AMP-acid ligase II
MRGPSEVVAVLRSDNDSLSSRTILLYGPGFAETKQKWSTSYNWQHQHGYCRLLPNGRFVSAPVSSFQGATQHLPRRDGSKMDSLAKYQRTRDAVLVYTSGTFEWFKGVRLSHAAVLIQAWAKLQHRVSILLQSYFSHNCPILSRGRTE